MSDPTSAKVGPVMADSVDEVQGIFPSDAAMEEAISKLTLAGFDRADFSLPTTSPTGGTATPEQGAATPLTDTDLRQARNMGTGMAGSIGAMAAAGATIATGGVAGVAIAAAAAVGVGSALVANAVGTAAKTAQAEGHEADAQAGKLVLSVHVASADKQADAERIMRVAGASAVVAVTRAATSDVGVDSSGWTG